MSIEETLERFDKKFIEAEFLHGFPVRIPIKLREDIKQFITEEVSKNRIEIIDMISNSQGWEETRDIYAEKLGLPKKYDKK